MISYCDVTLTVIATISSIGMTTIAAIFITVVTWTQANLQEIRKSASAWRKRTNVRSQRCGHLYFEYGFGVMLGAILWHDYRD